MKNALKEPGLGLERWMMGIFHTNVRTCVQISSTHLKSWECLPAPTAQHQEAEPRASLWLVKNVPVQEETLSQGTKVESNRGRHWVSFSGLPKYRDIHTPPMYTREKKGTEPHLLCSGVIEGLQVRGLRPRKHGVRRLTSWVVAG